MKKILIVEDEESMRLGLVDNLKFEGYEVDIAEDGKIGLEKIKKNVYDLILLDVMLPIISGFDVCRTIRREGNNTPVILLTAKGEEIDKVLGLELGADDYVTKPFSLRELLARIKVHLRRGVSYAENASEIIKIGKLNINFSTFNVFENDKPIILSTKEFDMLRYLWEKKNITVARDELLEKVWGQNIYTTTRTIDNFIVKLRQKVEENAKEPKIIITVHGIGYRLIN
ncbi:MAG: response regulator transcription factor [Melioribacteraceae bacterium]|nr:response regulator transcription factor [Melioribacteraceae bacterium]